ncbi:MAG: type II toxin-antitoxin system HipA family toxin [Acidaminococcaceae bacterium]|nr:type II toxin-antitoxin system HipA family toxin [Acidaminococcaceae bacterium]
MIDVKKINVLLRDEPVGTLQRDPANGVCVFEYDKGWLANGFSLSPTELPLQSGLFYADKDKFGGGFAVFEDSLPDGYGLYLLDRMLRKQNTSLMELNPLQRLSIIGTAGMGALTYLPMMTGFHAQKELEDIAQLDHLQEEALKVLSEKGVGDESYLYYNSANSGGARPKTALRSRDGSHWLVKFRHVYDPEDIGKSEFLYMKTARACGITIPRIGLVKDRYFAIERFDFAPDGKKRHVVTAAALLKTDFRKQDVDYINLLALTGYLTQDPGQVEEMFRRMVMNLVAINKDDHSKNFSFLCDDGKWSLAPAYDITYSPLGSNGEHATSLFYNGNPGFDLVLKAGTEIRIPESTCRTIIKEVEETCEKHLPVVSRLTH